MQIRTLKETEIEKWIDFVWGIFPYESRAYFENQWYNDPYRNINGILVAVDESDSILSTLRIFYRELNVSGDKVRSGGIGSVGTLEAYRGKGLAKALFKEAITVMENEDIKISFLLSGFHNEKLYNNLGYFKSSLKFKTCAVSQDVSYPVDYTIRNIDMDQELTYLIKMHEHFTMRFNGTVVRTECYWKQWFSSISGETKVAVTPLGEVIAYIHVADGDHLIEVNEFGTMPGYEAIFDAFVFNIAKEKNLQSANVVFADAIHSDLPVIETKEAGLCMFRLIKPFVLNDVEINNTLQLIEAIKGDQAESKMLLWMTDDI